MNLDPAFLLIQAQACEAFLQDATPDATGLSAWRSIVRMAIGLLIVVLLAYIAIEQVGTRRRRRKDRE